MKNLFLLVILGMFFSCQSQVELSLKHYNKDSSKLELKTKIFQKSAKHFSLVVEIKNPTKKKLYLNIPDGYYWGDFLFIRSPKDNIALQKHINLKSDLKDKNGVRIVSLAQNEKKTVTIDMKLINKKGKKGNFRVIDTGHHEFYFPKKSGTYIIKVIFTSRLSPLHYSNQIPENSIIWQGTIQSYDTLLKI